MSTPDDDWYWNLGAVAHGSGAGAAGGFATVASVQLLRNTRIVPPLSPEL
jgi:hypothetical protein